MAHRVRTGYLLLAGLSVASLSSFLTIHPAMAQDADAGGGGGDDDEEGHKGPDMHKLAKKPPLPRAHKDFSKFRYIPAGDKVVEEADKNRLFFWTKDGQPDGYAQRRGDSIIYYNAQGQAMRVQRLEPNELVD
ncbi:hypothetical protein ACI01nite_01410 [Acetobacter cibinongensis]|uniref:Uncharacterized protein n=1 Tax=Acetobacter cibinongensis TaxID=146475 RepID=A0A0D6N1V9_9PROT|nr:hypothetical protein [Acetobacter cibinongensis]GAN59919.1 hypothetical protein Abci_008_052 [Acetobacter cibinongensis]GBQ16343.1 hypothetical protein AA0482_1515 [Acetobacter cibinongensis NRIC 0482]GEL57539.1 hypothetical protein ACI01nite_01410 [Acetobacter cibinongensis]